MKVVGIIGAGAAGLCTLRHVLSMDGLMPVIWERSRSVGGTWVYTDNCGKDEFGLPLHSSMYKNLRTNLPKEVMAFPEFPFKTEGESFLTHSAVLEYLEQYTSHFQLKDHIKFCHNIEDVSPVQPGKSDTEWQVTVRDLESGKVKTTVCQSVIVCTGHYSIPYEPVIEGMEQFTGIKGHSHNYRTPHPFQGKTVIILGVGASGRDIAIEISSVAQKVYLSHNMPIPIPSTLPDNVSQISGVASVKENNTFILNDGTEVAADAFLFCTGYHYSYPFLSADCEIETSVRRVWPLYRHIIHCKYPTMAFIGIPMLVCPFPLFDIQARYVALCFTGLVPLPSSEQMMTIVEEDLEKRRALGEKQSGYHVLGIPGQWIYFEELLKEMRLKFDENISECDKETTVSSDNNNSSQKIDLYLVPSYMRQIFLTAGVRSYVQPQFFKNYNYHLLKDGNGNVVSYQEYLNEQNTSLSRDLVRWSLTQLPQYLVPNIRALAVLICQKLYYKLKRILFY